MKLPISLVVITLNEESNIERCLQSVPFASDIVVVDTEDALLVTTTAHAQRVKSVVDALKLGGSSDVL